MVQIDLRKAGPVISPLLFGHNIEHTRRCVWQGLSAQLLQNRKFAGEPDENGVAFGWRAIGRTNVRFSLDKRTYFAARGSQKIRMLTNGAPCGIAQPGLPLKKGAEYRLRLLLKVDRSMRVQVSLRGTRGKKTYFQIGTGISPGRWAEKEFVFIAPATDRKAVLEITFNRAGALWVGAASLLPADSYRGMREDVIKKLRRISAPYLRWPGGNFSGDYCWRHGLLAADKRPPLKAHWPDTLKYTNGYDFHEINTDDFIALCRRLGSEPSITIDISHTTPEEAAAWVEYANGSPSTPWGRRRARRGYKKPYGVKYWSIGNEIWGYWMPSHCSAGKYARKAKDYVRAMKRVDPSIIIIGSGHGLISGKTSIRWDKRVLAELGGDMDYLSLHNYTREMKTTTGAEGKKEFTRVVEDPTRGVLKRLRRERRLAKKHAPPGSSVKLSLDEWNVWAAWFRKVGVAEGIYVASMLNMFCREAGKLGMDLNAYFEPINEGAIDVGCFSARLTAVGRIFELFRVHHGNRLAKLTSSEEGFDATASITVDGKRAFITVVNRNPSTSAKATFSLQSRGRIKKLSATLLTAQGFQPGTRFTKRSGEVKKTRDGAFRLLMPKHSVALLTIALGS